MCVLWLQRPHMGKRVTETARTPYEKGRARAWGEWSAFEASLANRTTGDCGSRKPRSAHRTFGSVHPGCLLQSHTMGNHGPESRGSDRDRTAGLPEKDSAEHVSRHTRGNPGPESRGSTKFVDSRVAWRTSSERSDNEENKPVCRPVCARTAHASAGRDGEAGRPVRGPAL